MKISKFILLFSAIFTITAQNSFSEIIPSVSINESGQLITSIRFGNNNTKIVELENGKKVKLISVGPFYFKNGDPPALVLKYETEIELTNYEALKAEVYDVWKLFRKDVEKTSFTTAAIRAQRPLKGKVVRTGQGYGFVFLKKKDGSWEHKK